jgi:hypothetical protein
MGANLHFVFKLAPMSLLSKHSITEQEKKGRALLYSLSSLMSSDQSRIVESDGLPIEEYIQCREARIS